MILLDPLGLGFMSRALAGCVALSVAGPPLGVVLVLRRMSLMTDPLQHGILPGIAVGASLAGLTVWGMGLGGLVAGVIVAVLAGVIARDGRAGEDAALAGVYLVALALGVAILSLRRGIDLTALLFGSVLAVDDQTLLTMAASASVTLIGLALIWRPLVMESFDPGFLAAIGGPGGRAHLVFLSLVVLCVVAGFVALGTLMSVGLMMLPAVAARHWSRTLGGQVGAAVAIGVAASVIGLLVSFHADIPAGPAVVLAAGALWIASLAFGPRGGLARRRLRRALPA